MNKYRKPTPIRDEYILSPEDAENASTDWHFSITPQQVDRLLAGYSLFHTENFGDCVLFSVDSENKKLAQCNLPALLRDLRELRILLQWIDGLDNESLSILDKWLERDIDNLR